MKKKGKALEYVVQPMLKYFRVGICSVTGNIFWQKKFAVNVPEACQTQITLVHGVTAMGLNKGI